MKNPCTSPAVVLSTSIEPLESRIAPAFATVLDLAALTGPNGFQFSLGGFTDGASISTLDAGDINADGFADIIANADYVTFGGVHKLESYVVFGKNGGFPAEVNLFGLQSGEGFRVGDATAGDLVTKVSAAGDINDDGFADLVVSGSGTNISSADYVLFGHGGAFPAVVPLSSISGPTGLKINDGARGVIAAGDINGDNVDDMLINDRGTGGFPGASYVIFGRSGTFAGTIEISGLTGVDGFKITGVFPGSGSGAGDVNGDGFGDLIIGSPSGGGNASGIIDVIFGHGGAFPATFNVSSLNGSNGFKLDGKIEDLRAGTSVSGAGDINHDGFDDVVVGSDAEFQGDVYVVFGHAGAFPTSINLPSLTAPTGLVIVTGPRDEDAALAVSDAGDVNGDGFDDVLIGDRQALIFNDYDDHVGVSYVVYGHGGAFPDQLALSSLDGKQGFQINGNGSGSSVHGAGDVNGDGFDDVLIAGTHTSYVLFGPGFTPILPKISDNGRNATFIDGDGDRVTVKTTRGSFDASKFAINAAPGGVTGGGHFGGLDLSDAEFAGANLTITAKRGERGGDGLVNLGFLDATGIDLGKVRIDGDLGRLEVGDGALLTPAIGMLDVVSMGAFGVFTQFDIVQGIDSNVVGSIPNVKIATDLREIRLIADTLGTVKVGGSIGASENEQSIYTRIFLSGSLSSLSVGGDLQFTTISVADDIGRIAGVGASGKVKYIDGIAVQGSILQSSISAGGDISRLTVGGNIKTSGIGAEGEANPADLLAAQTIGEIIVNGRVERSYISAGDNDRPDVQIGRISVGTNWVASSLFIGADLNFSNPMVGQGGGDPAILASIASIVIKGHVLGTVGGNDKFGFFAEKIVAFESGNAALPMTDGADTFNVGITFDTTVRDIV